MQGSYTTVTDWKTGIWSLLLIGTENYAAIIYYIIYIQLRSDYLS